MREANGRSERLVDTTPRITVQTTPVIPEPIKIVPITPLRPVPRNGKMSVGPFAPSRVSATVLTSSLSPVGTTNGNPTSSATTGLGSQVIAETQGLGLDLESMFGGSLGVSGGGSVAAAGGGTITGNNVFGIPSNVVGIALVCLLAYFVLR